VVDLNWGQLGPILVNVNNLEMDMYMYLDL
jgi:hypothetical protein